MIKGDKIRLVKPMGIFTNVGEVCEVTDIRQDGSIWFRFGGVNPGFGCMSYDEYKKYFEPVDECQKITWSKWKRYSYGVDLSYQVKCDDDYLDGDIFDSGEIWYRDNGKRVQVRKIIDGKIFKASATCCKKDSFEKSIGMRLALRRLLPKILSYKVECDAKNM